MKKFVLLLMLTGLLAYSGNAQEYDEFLEVSREVLKVEKKILITELMQLSKEEREKFWPLYNEFEQKKYEINTRYFKMINEFAENFGRMSPDKAKAILEEAIRIEEDLTKLDKKYYKRFQKILTPQKALRYYQAENKIKAFINAELATQVPLLEDIEE